MASGAVAVPGLGHVPVLVAVGGVAGGAESCIVVEPGRVDLGVGRGWLERLDDQFCPAGLDGVARVPVLGSYALEDEVPLFWVAMQEEEALPVAVPLFPPGREFSWHHQLDAGAW